jgi:hypothetical protein
MKTPFPSLRIFVWLAFSVAGLPLCAQEANEGNWQVPVTLGKDGWMVYENARFGSIIPVPPGMTPNRPPDNGDGQSFSTPDSKVTLATYGSFNVEGTGDLNRRWKDALAEPGRTITYKRKTDAWFVVSGITEDGMGFYERYTANSKYGAGWYIRYPQSEEKKYSPWIERIAKSYEARLGKGADTVE